MITREKAYGLIDQHIKNPNMRKHMIAVSVIMYSLAEELREDPMLWEIVELQGPLAPLAHSEPDNKSYIDLRTMLPTRPDVRE